MLNIETDLEALAGLGLVALEETDDDDCAESATQEYDRLLETGEPIPLDVGLRALAVGYDVSALEGYARTTSMETDTDE